MGRSRSKDECIWINSDALDDPALWALPPDEWGRKFREAMAGATNEFSRYISLTDPYEAEDAQ